MLKRFSTVLIRDILSLTPPGAAYRLSSSAVLPNCARPPHSTALPPLRETELYLLF